MNRPNVVVVGSGLSAIGAIKALISNGIKPTVLDVGESLDSERTNRMYQLAQTDPSQWTPEDRDFFNKSNILKKGSSIPKKTRVRFRLFLWQIEKKCDG
jgi:UDP-N-acetylmuramoylalanine-D-glutamate ligase